MKTRVKHISRKVLREVLIILRDDGPDESSHGICVNAARLYSRHYGEYDWVAPTPTVVDDVSKAIQYYTQGWSLHSRNKEYPVPSDFSPFMPDPQYAYAQHMMYNTMWSGEYGKLRMQLLKYLIRKLR